MAGDSSSSGATYSPAVGLIYVFNLIVGTGALTLPAAFANAGWVISLIIILALAVISYITLTFVVETMAVANALQRNRRATSQKNKEVNKAEDESSSKNSDDDSEPPFPTKSLLERLKIRKKSPHGGPYYSILQPETNSVDHLAVNSTAELVESADQHQENRVENCQIEETIEMGKMAGMFFNKTGNVLFFICIAIYLYGDLAIYGAAVGKSLRDTACTYFPPDAPCNATLNGTMPCWEGVDSINRDNAYRLFLSIFVIVIGSFGFFNVQKTLLLQMLTTVVRWTAFILMIVMACIRISKYDPSNVDSDPIGHPSAAIIGGVPNLFGACVYSFMCHHSLPSLITPISPKRGLYRLLVSDYVLIAAFYLLLSFTGIYAFPQPEGLYTLSFVQNRCKEASVGQQVINYFLALFPVFTLSTSFPIITITLRNNLKQLFLTKDDAEYSFVVRRLLFPFLALIPPTVVALATSDIQFLVGITGSYAGAGVQYVVPALLAFYSRRALISEFGTNTVQNAFASPFKHVAYVVFVLAWSVACIGFVTYNHIATGK